MAVLLLSGVSVWEAALLAAILAPTDAALGQAVVNSPKLPVRIRQALNVESGLNDGLALPVVLIFLSLAAGQHGKETGEWLSYRFYRRCPLNTLSALSLAPRRTEMYCSSSRGVDFPKMLRS